MKQTLDNYIADVETFSEETDTVQDNRSFGKKCLDAYFEPKGFEKWKNGRVYEWIGVGYFQKMFDKLIVTPRGYKGVNTPWTVGKPDKENLEKFKKYSCFNEAVHCLGALPAVFLGGLSLYSGDFALTSVLSIIALPSVSLSILQRYNRARVQNVLDKRYGGSE